MDIARKDLEALGFPIEADAEPARLTEHLWTEWQTTDEDIADLIKQEDQLIEQGKEVPASLDEALDELTAYQRKIVLDALSIRSETLRDICMKLEIWQAHTFGEKVRPHLLQPSDLLIRQTIRELAELAPKS